MLDMDRKNLMEMFFVSQNQTQLILIFSGLHVVQNFVFSVFFSFFLHVKKKFLNKGKQKRIV